MVQARRDVGHRRAGESLHGRTVGTRKIAVAHFAVVAQPPAKHITRGIQGARVTRPHHEPSGDIRQVDAGRGHVDQALRLSPRDPIVTLWYGILSIAAFIDERYDEAAEAALSAIRAQPNRHTAYLDLAAAYAGAGNLDQAAEAVATVRRMTPGATIGKAMRSHPFTRPKDRERYIGALRAAGLPEE